MVEYLSRVGAGLRWSAAGSRQDVVVTEPSSALSSSLKSDPTPDSTSSMSSCDTASPSAKMSLSVSLLRSTSHAFDIFFLDDDGDNDCTGSIGGGAGGGGGGFTSLLTASVSAISTTDYTDIITRTYRRRAMQSSRRSAHTYARSLVLAKRLPAKNDSEMTYFCVE